MTSLTLGSAKLMVKVVVEIGWISDLERILSFFVLLCAAEIDFWKTRKKEEREKKEKSMLPYYRCPSKTNENAAYTVLLRHKRRSLAIVRETTTQTATKDGAFDFMVIKWSFIDVALQVIVKTDLLAKFDF